MLVKRTGARLLTVGQTSVVRRLTLALAAVAVGQGSYVPGSDEHRRVSNINDAIVEYVKAHGDYPASLDELCKMFPSRYCWWGTDSWDQPFWYRPLAGGYELFSGGADHLPWTDDDVLPVLYWGNCGLVWAGTEWKDMGAIPLIRLPDNGFYGDSSWEPRADGRLASLDPRDLAGMELGRLREELVERQIARRLPYSLEGLGKLGIGRRREEFNQFIDPWGTRYHYEVLRWGYDLYSYGPDRMPDTEDDVWPNDKSENCVRRQVPGVQSDTQQGEPPLIRDVASRRRWSLELAEEWRVQRCRALSGVPRAYVEYNRVCVSGDDSALLAEPERAAVAAIGDPAASGRAEPDAGEPLRDAEAPNGGFGIGRAPMGCGCTIVGVK